MNYTTAMPIAIELQDKLAYVCERIEIAGSLRRKRPQVNDIELLCIPLYDATDASIDLLDCAIRRLISGAYIGSYLDYRLNKRGSKVYGPQNKLLVHMQSGIGVDIFSTTKENWPVSLVVRTGSAKNNILIAKAAIRKGWRFHAYGSGFTDEHGNTIICKTEQDVFEFVGLKYKIPEERSL